MSFSSSQHSNMTTELSEIIQKNKEVLIFRLSAMGDIALLTGVLRYWHDTFGLRFIIVSRSSFLDLFKNHPAVIECYALEKEDLQGKAYREKCKELAQKYADYPLLDMHASTRSRLLASFWKNKVLRYNKLPVYRRLFLWTKGRFGSAKLLEKNVCQRYASLLSQENISREMLVPQIYLSDEERENARKRLFHLLSDTLKNDNPSAELIGAGVLGNAIIGKSLENSENSENSENLEALESSENRSLCVSTKKIIAIHPFATHLSKTLTMQAWLSLAEKISKIFGKSHEILWLGIGEFPVNAQGKSLINQTSLRDLCAILYHCDVLITGDSGPMHLANAVQCKLVALFGPTCEEWGFYPVGENVEIIQKDFSCRPCSLHGAKPCSKNCECLLTITENEIIERVAGLLV